MANRNKNSDIFRQKSLDRVSSPENLDKYIKSTTPSLWLFLGAVILILIGIFAWGAFGKIDSASVVGCRVENGTATSYIKEAEYGKFCEESYMKINGETYRIDSVTGPSIVSENSDAFLVQAAGIEEGTWYYTVTCTTNLKSGEYKGTVVYEKISPISFIIN